MGKILNYGLFRKNSKTYRKALRQCRKHKRVYGASFDSSEIYNLCITFYKYCLHHNFSKDKFILHFHNYDLERYYLDNFVRIQNKNIILYSKNMKLVEHIKLREKKFNERSDAVNKEILDTMNDKQRSELCIFLVPRLKAFKDRTMRFPSDMRMEEWQEYIQMCIDEIQQKGTIDLFIKRIRDFWL